MSDLVDISRLEVEVFPDRTEQTKRERGLVHSIETWQRVHRLGQGGFADVFLERCIVRKEHKYRAVKQLKKNGVSSKIDYRRELEAAALFSQPKYDGVFVDFFGWYETPEDVFLAMEYLPLGDLSSYMNHRFPEIESRTIVRQILVGLDFMHERDFIHRDLKPANILVHQRGPDWWVKIADFGISKRARAGDETLRTLVYSPHYVAPEVLVDDSSYTRAVDIWSTGTIAFCLLTGEKTLLERRELIKYYFDSDEFPVDRLGDCKVSSDGRDFLASLLAPVPEKRPSASECLQHSWMIIDDIGTSQAESRLVDRGTTTSSFSGGYVASWTTQASARPVTTINRTMEGPIPRDLSAEAGGIIDAQQSAQASTALSEADTAVNDNISQPSGRHPPPLPQRPTVVARDSKVPPSSTLPLAKRDWKGICRLQGHKRSVSAVAFSPDGQMVVTASHDKTLRLWRISNGAEIRQLVGHSGNIFGVAFSPDGKHIISGAEDDTARIWEAVSGQEVRKLIGHTSFVKSVACSPDGQLVATSSLDKTARIWAFSDGKELHRLTGHSDTVRAVAFSPDGQLVATGSDDKTARLWDTTTGLEIRRLLSKFGYVNSVAFSPNGQLLAAGTDELVLLWNTKTGKEFLQLTGHCDCIRSVTFSPDGKLLATASEDKTGRLYDAETGVVLQRFTGHSDVLMSVAFSPDGTCLASASRDKTVLLRDMTILKAVEDIEPESYTPGQLAVRIFRAFKLGYDG